MSQLASKRDQLQIKIDLVKKLTKDKYSKIVNDGSIIVIGKACIFARIGAVQLTDGQQVALLDVLVTSQ
jgi:hypothetical protein